MSEVALDEKFEEELRCLVDECFQHFTYREAVVRVQKILKFARLVLPSPLFDEFRGFVKERMVEEAEE